MPLFRKSYSYSSISEKNCQCFCCGTACCGGCCKKCIGRIPYATLIATVLCCSGVSIFLGTLYRAMILTLRMFEEIFKFRFVWLADLHLVFIGVGAFMGVISLLVLFVSFLATGATREQVCQGWKSRVGGRITCIVLMVIKYILFWIWLLMLICMVVATFVMSLWLGMCNNLKYEPNPDNRCIDLKQFRFLFPNGTDPNYLRICDGKAQIFCKDCVEQSELMYILALFACFLVVISLVHYLICLAANYARIQEKYQKFEIQYLQETEMGSLPKDRF